jgi:aspartyl protease family protein
MSENPHRRSGLIMLTLAWAMLFALAYWYFSGRIEQAENPNDAAKLARQYGEVRLQRNADGHYVADGEINGQAVVFLLDTGASRVALSAALAGQLGLAHGAAVSVQTANGTSKAYQTRLDSVRLGAIEVRDVPALITDGLDSHTVLLGMSFLKQLEFTQRGNQLTLKPLTHP